MEFIPNRSGEVSVDGTGSVKVKLVEGEPIDLPERLVKFLTDCGWKQEELSDEQCTVKQDKIDSLKTIKDAQEFAKENDIELESKKLADIKKELIEKMQ